MAADERPLSASERQVLVRDIARDVMGLGPLEPLLADPTISEIMVNGHEAVYVERAGVITHSGARFLSDDHLRRVIDRIVGQVGRRIDESSPMVDARLADGSRVNAIVPPLSLDGPILTIRKFSHDPFQVADLIALNTLTESVATMLTAAPSKGGLNVLISGGTGTGKTTHAQRPVVASCPRTSASSPSRTPWSCSCTSSTSSDWRPGRPTSRARARSRSATWSATRCACGPTGSSSARCRGAEALDMLQAMNTGHDGSLSTIHANTPADALARLETMVLMAGFDLPTRAIREQVASALNLIVQVQRFRDGSRRITHVTEVVGMEGEVITLQDVFRYDHSLGASIATGIRPEFTEQPRGCRRRPAGSRCSGIWSCRGDDEAHPGRSPSATVVLAAQPAAAATAPATPDNFEVMLVVDTSGSMDEAPMQQARDGRSVLRGADARRGPHRGRVVRRERSPSGRHRRSTTRW